MRATMPRSSSHCKSLGTNATAACVFGLETTPTVLMVGIEEKLLVPFGAEDGAVHDAGFESKSPHGAGHPLAGGLMELRVANDAALANLPLPYFKLRLDQYN